MMTVVIENSKEAGPDLREGKVGSCPAPPQLGGLHKNSNKIIT